MKNKILAYIINILFIAVTLISAIDIMCFNKSFYTYEYNKLNVSETIGISNDDLMKSTDVLLDYIKDKRDNIDVMVDIDGQTVNMFNQREIDHMVDVKDLYLSVKNVSNISVFLLIFIILIYVYKNKTIFKDLITSFKRVILILSAILSALLTYAIIDFNNFWNGFHHIFFTNDLWILDPNTDRMILMVPSDFFYNLIISIVIIFLLLLIIYYFILKFMYKKENESDN